MRELLLSTVMAYTLTMHWMVPLLFSALLGVSFGHTTVNQESSPVSHVLLWLTTTLVPRRCITMQFTRYLKGFWVETSFSITSSHISLIQWGTSFSSQDLGPRQASTVSTMIFSMSSLGNEISSSSSPDMTNQYNLQDKGVIDRQYHQCGQMNTFHPDRYPTFSSLVYGQSSSQHFFLRQCLYTGHYMISEMRRKRKCMAKMKASTAQRSWVRGMSWVVEVYLVVKFISRTNMKSFMLQVRQKWTRRYLRQRGQQYMATQRQALCTQHTAIIAQRGWSYSMVSTRASSTFLRQLTNQKYFVKVLKLVRMRQLIAENEQSRIHSGLISSSLALSSSRKRMTTSPARKKEEVSAPAVAKVELKVRLAIWVKMFMFISMREKQKNTMSRCSQRMLCSRFSHRQQQEVRLTCLLSSHTSSPSPSAACDPLCSPSSGTPSIAVLIILISSFFLRQFLTILITTAINRHPTKTMSQVNWFPKKLAVLKSSLYLPKMFWPSVEATESSGSTSQRDPSARFWKVQELMLKAQRRTRNSSSCCGKQRLMSTISDSSWTSSTVLQTKYFIPFTNTAHSPSASVPAINTTMSIFTLSLKPPSL